MDELMEMFNSFIGEAFEREKAMHTEFLDFEKKLNDCVAQARDRGTPIQNKKRPKRQISISEHDETEGSSCSGKDETATSVADEKERPKQAQGTRTSGRMLNVAESEPQSMDTTTSVGEADPAFARPSRTARLKAQEKLKEPSLQAKIRNDHGTLKIKTERASTAVANSTLHASDDQVMATVPEKPAPPVGGQPEGRTYVHMETENDANQANRIDALPNVNASSKKSTSARETASLMIMPQLVPKVELISDEEMPPPKMPPPKAAVPKVRTKKKLTPADKNGSVANVTAGSADSTMNSTSGSKQSNTRRVGRPRKAETKPVDVVAPKSAPKSVPMPLSDPLIEPIRIKTEKLSIERPEPIPEPVKSVPSPEAASLEQQLAQMRPLRIELEKISVPQRTSPLANMDGTYVMAQPSGTNDTFVVPPAIQDSTFTVKSPLGPAADARCDETFNIPAKNQSPNGASGVANGTFVVAKDTCDTQAQPEAATNVSIMTEDESVVENSPNQWPGPKPKQMLTVVPSIPTTVKGKNITPSMAQKKAISGSQRPAGEAKKNKELFNPCVMSPIKSRIEAFEKCAVTTGTTTSSKTGTPQALAERLFKTVSTPSIGTEPSHGLVRSAHAKPLAYTPNCATAAPLVKAASVSKIAQMQSRTAATRSQSRDSSWDRAMAGGSGTLSAASSTSSLLDEKKKKREEKQRLATIQREAIEREKREHAERLLHEKEEKYRKLVQEKQEKLRIDAQKKARKQEEFERRRQLEEQRTLADQKREELAKQLAEQQRIDRELLDAVKHTQTKENHEMKLHKQMYQQKLRQQQQLEKQHQKKMATSKGHQQQQQLFTFEMIDTDDTTDEEVAEDPSAPRKKKRPPTPAWCEKTAEFRRALTIQAQVDTKVIDQLFSVQPMTPDLRQLFPSIDAYKLKRNSSAIWRTPPRYSQLP